MNKKGYFTVNVLTVAAVLLAVFGIIAGSMSFYHSSSQLLREHQMHLEDIARSVDQNTVNLCGQIREDLEYSAQHCTDDLQNSPIGEEDLIAGLMTLDGDGTVKILQGDAEDIRFLGNEDGDSLCLCVDREDNSYLAFLAEGADGITYGALMKLETFYETIVVNSIIYHYWVVLYDRKSNLMLQNDEEQPAYLLLEREEITERNDGYSMLQKRELDNSSGSDMYSYINTDTNEKETCQISILTSQDSLNRSFAIGVAANTRHITEAARSTFIHSTMCSLLIVFSISLLLYGIMNHRRESRELREKLDLTEQILSKQTELARNQRLESLGVMTSAIAHEFNNLLTPITGYSLMCMESIPEESGEMYDNLLAIYQAADKAKITVRRLSELTRKNSDAAYATVCPDAIVERVQEISFPSKPKQVKLETSLSCGDLLIRANETQILQVLLNFLLNAFQAMENMEGTVSVTTERDQKEVVFTVSDTGPGIPKEILERIFEPFFTTKETGKGSGLGLAIASQVAESHGGSVSVQSETGNGASFRLRLPLYEEDPDIV